MTYRRWGRPTARDKFEKAVEYRQFLVRALHSCGVKFPQVAGSIVPQLMEFLADSTTSSGMDVILFVREAFERLPVLREEVGIVSGYANSTVAAGKELT